MSNLGQLISDLAKILYSDILNFSLLLREVKESEREGRMSNLILALDDDTHMPINFQGNCLSTDTNKTKSNEYHVKKFLLFRHCVTYQDTVIPKHPAVSIEETLAYEPVKELIPEFSDML